MRLVASSWSRRVLPALGLALTAVGCAGSGGTLAGREDLACRAEAASFAGSVALAPAAGQAYEAADVQSLSREMAATDRQIAAAQAAFDAVQTCRIGVAAALRTTPNAPRAAQRLAAEEAAFRADLAVARDFETRIGHGIAQLRSRADAFVAAAPGGRARLAAALAAPPPPMQPYLALAVAAIHERPDAGSARLADLRKGQRVGGPVDPAPVPGWILLTLNDGSRGYAESAQLRPLTPNPSAVKSAERAAAARQAAADPVVALALTARSGLPQHAAGFEARLESSAATAATAFRAGTPASSLAALQ